MRVMTEIFSLGKIFCKFSHFPDNSQLEPAEAADALVPFQWFAEADPFWLPLNSVF